MTRGDPIEAILRQPPPDERGYAPPGLRSSARLGRPADPMWRDTGRPPSRSIMFAVATILVALTVGVIALIGGVAHSPQAGEPTTPPTSSPSADVSGPARALGVDPQAVIRTADGYVAARRNDGAVELAVAQPSSEGWSSRVLASFIEPPGFGGSASFEVTCDPSFALRQPNFVYGDFQGASGTPAATIRVTGLSGSGSPFGIGPWLVAFSSEGPIHDVHYELTADRGQQYRPEPIGGGSFHDPQRCGTVEDLAKTPEPSAPASLAAGFGRLVLEPGQVTYNNEPAPTGPVASYPLRIVAGDGSTVYQTQMTGEQSVPVASGTYSIEVEGGLNDCDASVSVKSGTTTVVFIEWFAGGCQITLEAQK